MKPAPCFSLHNSSALRAAFGLFVELLVLSIAASGLPCPTPSSMEELADPVVPSVGDTARHIPCPQSSASLSVEWPAGKDTPKTPLQPTRRPSAVGSFGFGGALVLISVLATVVLLSQCLRILTRKDEVSRGSKRDLSQQEDSLSLGACGGGDPSKQDARSGLRRRDASLEQLFDVVVEEFYRMISCLEIAVQRESDLELRLETMVLVVGLCANELAAMSPFTDGNLELKRRDAALRLFDSVNLLQKSCLQRGFEFAEQKLQALMQYLSSVCTAKAPSTVMGRVERDRRLLTLLQGQRYAFRAAGFVFLPQNEEFAAYELRDRVDFLLLHLLGMRLSHLANEEPYTRAIEFFFSRNKNIFSVLDRDMLSNARQGGSTQTLDEHLEALKSMITILSGTPRSRSRFIQGAQSSPPATTAQVQLPRGDDSVQSAAHTQWRDPFSQRTGLAPQGHGPWFSGVLTFPPYSPSVTKQDGGAHRHHHLGGAGSEQKEQGTGRDSEQSLQGSGSQQQPQHPPQTDSSTTAPSSKQATPEHSPTATLFSGAGSSIWKLIDTHVQDTGLGSEQSSDGWGSQPQPKHTPQTDSSRSAPVSLPEVPAFPRTETLLSLPGSAIWGGGDKGKDGTGRDSEQSSDGWGSQQQPKHTPQTDSSRSAPLSQPDAPSFPNAEFLLSIHGGSLWGSGDKGREGTGHGSEQSSDGWGSQQQPKHFPQTDSSRSAPLSQPGALAFPSTSSLFSLHGYSIWGSAAGTGSGWPPERPQEIPRTSTWPAHGPQEIPGQSVWPPYRPQAIPRPSFWLPIVSHSVGVTQEQHGRSDGSGADREESPPPGELPELEQQGDPFDSKYEERP